MWIVAGTRIYSQLCSVGQEFVLGRLIDSHRYYDEGEVLGCLAQVLRPVAKGWDDETRQALGVRYGDTDPFTLLSHLEELVADGRVDLPQSFLEMLLRHRDPILLMGRFFRAMRQSPTKDVVYCDTDLGALLNRQVDGPPRTSERPSPD